MFAVHYVFKVRKVHHNDTSLEIPFLHSLIVPTSFVSMDISMTKSDPLDRIIVAAGSSAFYLLKMLSVDGNMH
jgi:hypothetical protein